MARRRSSEPEENLLRPLAVRLVLLCFALAALAAALVSTAPATRDLFMPVRDRSAAELVDSFRDSREGGRRHEAIDIPAPWGTPVLAAHDGVVHRLFESERGGIGLYLLDRDRDRCTYYAHLASYARGVHVGLTVVRGETMGFVGSTGNASENAPHLHFAVYDVSGGRECSSGTPLDPLPLLVETTPAAD